MAQTWVISSMDEPGLLWSNADGWVEGGYDRFTDDERNTLRLPFGGMWLPVTTGVNTMSDDTKALHAQAQFELVWRALRELGIEQVNVSFDGSGDSGEITDVAVDYADHKLADELNAKLSAAQVELIDEDTLQPRTIELIKLIEELSDPLTTAYEDWWNNDGGFGELVWCASDEPPHLELSIEVRVVNTEHSSYELNRYGEEED